MELSPAASRDEAMSRFSVDHDTVQSSSSSSDDKKPASPSNVPKQKKEKKTKTKVDDDQLDTPSKRDHLANQSSITGRWNKEEHDKFIDALKKFGKDWKRVEQHIESRTGAQIRSHA